MDKYRKHIIDGKFPLKHLDCKYITKQRLKRLNVYQNMHYRTKTYNNICRWVETKCPNKKEIVEQTTENNFSISETADDNILYIGSNKRYKYIINRSKYRENKLKEINEILGGGKIDTTKFQTTGYTVQWLAVLSTISDMKKYMRKGFLEYKKKAVPFLEEKVPNGFDKLNENCYLYTSDSARFKKYKGYKYISSERIPINNSLHIKNIKDWLNENGIRLIKYKN